MLTKILLVDPVLHCRHQAAESGIDIAHVIQSKRANWHVDVRSNPLQAIEFMAGSNVDVMISASPESVVGYADALRRVEFCYPDCHQLSLDDLRQVSSASEFDIDINRLIESIERISGMNSRLHDRELRRITSAIPSASSLTQTVMRELASRPIAGFNLGTYFDHARIVGNTSRAIAALCGDTFEDCENAFVAGTLHDVGKLVLAVHRPELFADAINLSNATGQPSWRAETAVFGTTHASVGAHMLGHWDYPRSIIDAVALHHQPLLGSDVEFSVLAAVHIANAVCSQRTPTGAIAWDEDYLDAIGMWGRVRCWAGNFDRHTDWISV